MSGNIAIVYSTGTDAVAQAFGDAVAGLAARVRVLWVPGDEDHERRAAHPIAAFDDVRWADAFDDVRWADGIAFGTPLGDGRPAGALMRFIEGMEPLWISAQYRAARLARLAGVLAEERHRHERFAL